MSRRRPALLAEVVLVVLWFLLFSRLHAAAGTSRAAATANARHLQSVEGALHLNIELTTNRWLVDHPALMQRLAPVPDGGYDGGGKSASRDTGEVVNAGS